MRLRLHVRLLAGVLFVANVALCSDVSYDQFQEFITAESERHGLFPNIFNLATNSLITANATCGQVGREEYCKLVEHVLLRKTSQEDSPQCDMCDANDVRHRHPIEFAIDGTRRWWQSPSLANGLEYEKVTILIDLRQEYQVAYIIVKMGNSPRPGTWVLEKSLDGVSYEPWQYFATNDAECMRVFGVAASVGVPRFQRDDEVHCTSEYSKITPLEFGEIHTSLVNGRPGAEKPSIDLQKFTRARFVRLRLISPRTLNADLMIINRQSHTIDKSVTMRYFYSISDISIGGQCICYGHAESCPSDPVTGQFKCECRHNTCGESCNRCCPLFNQLPWKPGTNAEPNVCQQCQCFNHADDCVYDEELDLNKWSITPEGVYEGGGRCLDCKHNTEGFNCERCKDGFYRASGLSHYRDDACRACDCDPLGSVSNVCVKDDQSAHAGQSPGSCLCKTGFGGRRCNRCAPGFRNHPTCEPCPCHQAGSVNFDTCEEDNCQCKANVEGLYCDRCKKGTINLQVDNPLGCQSCFCFGLTTECTQVNWNKAVISNNIGWNLTDLSGNKDTRPDTENGDVLIFNSNKNQDRSLYYWKAPNSFNGNMLNSYGGNLHYYVYFVPSEQGNAVAIADVIIEGNGIKLEYYSRMDFFPRENMTVLISIRETNGWYNSASRQPVEKVDMMRALANVEKFLVRGLYQQNQLQSSIFGLTIDTAVPPPPSFNASNDDTTVIADTLMRGVEVCACPQSFAGNSCESCDVGYRRVHNQLYGGRCEKCSCQGHSDTCDPFTGACLDCQHNTTGPRCELCLPGHYGNPSLFGEPGSCKPCACPTAENSRSNECVMSQLVVAGPAAAAEDAFVCTNCERGYEGNKCETCADGFFGDPLAANGSCVECECNGNIDAMAIGNCDRNTGKCIKCIGHTTGDHCERCKENHWGSAISHTCRSCGCHRIGSLDSQCSLEDGHCGCKENYIGMQCDRCKEGHGDVDNGCEKCECSDIGSLGDDCDAVSGQCTCKQGVFGKRCDQCRPSYFNLNENGCQFCHCNTYGSIEDGKCNNVTGACECRENVDGKMCEKCVTGYFNITSGSGCQKCDCDSVGSEGVSCDLHSGQCVCKPGVTGLKCDQCMPNHFGLSKSGCKECEKCPAVGQVCDAVTGACVCPPNTVGEMCENCASDAWDYNPLKGCKLCHCSDVGSSDGKCNVVTGQCTCKEGFVGLRCDRCTHGFFNFPKCEPCNCNVNGTDELQCKDGLCLCDEKGTCPCKKNVEGAKCDVCKEHTFSLSSLNANGCTECFCFNRTNECKQSDLLWQQVYAEDRKAVFEEPWEYYTKKHNLNVLKPWPAHLNSYPTDATPLYWSLPASMLGDRTNSYNGFLRLTIANEDNRRGVHNLRPDNQYFRYFPQVVLVGNNRIQLEHIPTQISDDGKYKIRLHESEWRSRQTPELAVTRKQMMVALQNVQGFYVRGSYNYPARGDSISLSEVSLDVAVPTSSIATGDVALGVEQCTACPQGYGGPSCQNPGDGYFRKKTNDYLNNADDIALVGIAEACACNGHSTSCNPETSLCLDCVHNTQGDFCERCKAGYIGDAREGGALACTKCACPVLENQFSDTCVAVNYGRGYVCNNCKAGHTGQYCESCIAGYYGNPEVVGGECSRCECHADGSLHGACDPLNGQCPCRPGVTGRDCSRCQERHAFINAVCTSCDQGCYQPLMQMIDELEVTLKSQDFSKLRPIPWKRVNRIENSTELINELLKNVLPKEGELMQENRYAEDATAVIEEAKFMWERVNKSALSLEQFTDIAQDAIDAAQEKYRDAFNTTNFLKHFHLYGGSSSVGGATLDSWAIEAEAHRNATVERGEYLQKRHNRAEQEQKKSEELLKKVTSNKLNDTVLENINGRMQDLDMWIQAFKETMFDEAKKDTMDADRMSVIVTKRIDRYNDVGSDIEKMRVQAEDELTKARDSVQRAKEEELLNLFDDTKFIASKLDKTKELAAECNNISLIYAQLIDEYDREFVESAEKHAAELEREGGRLQNLFSDTKTEAENPLRASHSYEQIIDALRNASEAANVAMDAAQEAYTLADAESDSSMLQAVAVSKNNSQVIAEDADKVSQAWIDLKAEEERKALGDRLSYVNEQHIDMVKRKDLVKTQWTQFDDQHDRMAGLKQTAEQAEHRAQEAKKTSQSLKSEVNDLAVQTERLVNSTGQSVRSTVDELRELRARIGDDAKVLDGVGDRKSVVKQRSEQMQHDIRRLKDRINEAREKAQQVRLSLSSTGSGSCRRSFMSPAVPSPVNHFSLMYRPLKEVPNSLLMITRTKARRTQSSEYIALEIKDGRAVVHWNIGSGKRQATNNHPINFIPPADASAWYHIEVERQGNGVNFTVSLRENIVGEGTKQRGDTVSVWVGKAEADNDVIFNTIAGETLLGLGSDEQTAQEVGLSSHKLRGVIGRLAVDGKNVPLWAFAESEGDCQGANPPKSTSPRGYMFRDGYAQIVKEEDVQERTPVITIAFNTYSPSGLLYFRGSETNGDFLALFLDDGHVVFKLNLGGKSVAEVRSQNIYADGVTHEIKAIRSNMEVHLQVDSDADRLSAAIPGENTALNIDNQNHYVAGVPPDMNRHAFGTSGVNWSGFFGCILHVKPNQFSELELDQPLRSQRREPGCHFDGATNKLQSNDRVIGFPEAGFFLTNGVTLDNNSSFAFAFRTKEENSTLVFQSSRMATSRSKRNVQETGAGYMAFYLFRGYLVLHIGKDASSRSKAVTMRSTQLYNDGQLHSVFMWRSGKTIRLRVDDRQIGKAETLDDESTIGSDDSRMFLGGFSNDVHPPDNEIPSSTAMIGCISHIYHNFKPVVLLPERHKSGNCKAQDTVFTPEKDEIVDEPIGMRKHSKIHFGDFGDVTGKDVPEPTAFESFSQPQCGAGLSSAVRDGEAAVRFGVSKSSHSRLNFASGQYPDISNFTLSMSLRTLKPDGAIWVWANYKNYTRYFYLDLIDGLATLEVKGHREPRILKAEGRRLNDGAWHDILIVRNDTTLSMKVDDMEAVTMTGCPKPKVMRRRMYIGGVISKHKTDFGLNKTGFDGCMRQVEVNGVAQKLEGQYSRDVLPCARPSKALFVYDGGYAVFEAMEKTDKHNEKAIDIAFEFRPLSREGTLLAFLSNADPENARITLEIKDEQVLLTILHTASSVELHDAIPVLRALCDGKWHSLRLQIDRNQSLLTIDGEKTELPKIANAAREHFVKLPVHIAGVSATLSNKLLVTSLSGCYRNLKLVDKSVYFEKAQRTNKVLVDACPFL